MQREPEGERSVLTVESTLPRPWEVEEDFHDVLYDWMQRAPWLAISVAAHLVVFLIIQAIPWNLFEEPRVFEVDSAVAVPDEQEFIDPPVEIQQPLDVPDAELDEPVVVDVTEPDVAATDFSDEPFSTGDPEFFASSPFEAKSFNAVIGIGGERGGKYGGRFGDGRGGGGRRRLQPNLDAGLRWLAAHQDADGMWDSDEFMKHDPADDPCSGPGGALHDVGVSSLALLSFLGDGNTMRVGKYRDVVTRGVRWLRDVQDFDNGCVPAPIGKHYLYDHALATLALSETYALSPLAVLRQPARNALAFCSRARNPYGAWRYDVPPIGDADTSVTGWMIFALEAGREAGLQVEEEALTAGLAWIDQVTDPATGRVGYDSVGSASSRIAGVNDRFPTDSGEAMTAVGLLCRFFLGQTPKEHPIMERHADLLLTRLPEWDPEGRGCDMYYWYYGSYAMWQMGGRWWKRWNAALEPTILDSQRRDGAHAGSWDPVGPWGHAGGRVYSTAMMTLCLETSFRYSRLVGAK